MSLEPERPAGEERRNSFPTVPWGILGTLFGLAAVINLWILLAFVTAALVELPLEEASVIARYGLLLSTQVVLIVVSIGAAVISSGGPDSLGLRPYSFRSLLEGAATGAALVAIGLAYSKLMEIGLPDLFRQMVAEQEQQLKLLAGPPALLLLMAVVIVPVGEELFFRGFIFGGLRGRLGFPIASGLSAALFALVHWMPWSLLPLFAVGLGTAVLYERHRSLATCMMAHAAYNLISLALEWAGP